MYPTLNLGPFVFPTAGIVYLLGVWLSLTLIERAAKQLHLNVEATYGLVVTGLIAGFLGARLLFVAEYWAAFQENLLGIIWPLTSGYNLGGGLFLARRGRFFTAVTNAFPSGPPSTRSLLASSPPSSPSAWPIFWPAPATAF